MLQSRPVTTRHEPGDGEQLVARPRGGAGGAGPARCGSSSSLDDAAALGAGDVLVTHMTSPDWVPLMRRAAAIVTDSGGMTCHAAIVSRELGIPCVVGTAHGNDEAARRRDRHRRRRPRRRAGRSSRRPRSAAAGGRRRRRRRLAARHRHAPARQPLRALAGRRAPRRCTSTASASCARSSWCSRRSRARIRALLLEEGRGDEIVDRMASALTVFADRVRAAADHLPHHRLPHERVPRAARAASASSREESNPMIGFRGALRYTREPELFASSSTRSRRVWHAGHTEPARDAAVRAHGARARAPVAISSREPGLLAPPRFRAVDHGRGSLRPLRARALRRAWDRRHLDRIERPHAAAPWRGPRLRAARRRVRRADHAVARLPAAS